MKIVALYKCFSGEEWLEPSVLSILPIVEKVVLLTSNVSWIGGRGNPSLPTVKELVARYPDKIIHINKDESNQLKHCEHGFRYIKKNLECDYVMLMDSDEIWDMANLKAAHDFLMQNPGHQAYRGKIHTYIKNAAYRISPTEPLSPVYFVRADRPNMGLEPRGCGIHPFITMEKVFCHHFGFVRYHFNKVLEKLVQSHVSEKQPYEDMSVWIPEVWNKLPDWNRSAFPNGFHPAIGFGHHWQEVKMVQLDADLPEILREEKYRHLLLYGR